MASHPQAQASDDTPHVEDTPCAGVTTKTPLAKAKARRNRYFVKNGRLYHILEVNMMQDIYLIENCGTEYTMWVTGFYLKEVKWISYVRSLGS